MRITIASTQEDSRERGRDSEYTVYWHIWVEYHKVDQKDPGEFLFGASGWYAEGGKHFRRIDIDRDPITKYTLYDIQQVARDFFDCRKISSPSSKIFFRKLAQFKL